MTPQLLSSPGPSTMLPRDLPMAPTHMPLLPMPTLLHTLTLTHTLPITPLPSAMPRLSLRQTPLSSTTASTATQDMDTLPTDTHTTLLTDTLPHTPMDMPMESKQLSLNNVFIVCMCSPR